LLELKKTTNFTFFNCGHSSVVERLVANEKVEGSTPFARSKRIFLNYITSFFQNFIKNRDIRSFKKKKFYFLLFRILRKFFNQDLIVNIYDFKVYASYKKNNTSHALLRKCDFDDQTELSILENVSKNNNIFLLDCGSNYGFYSLFVASLNSNNQIISIEASKTTSQLLKKNIELNSFKNIYLYNNALSDTDDEAVIFNESENDWESSISHKSFKLSNQVKVFTKKIDSIIKAEKATENQILFIKLDIEGNEFKALKGAYNVIQKFEPIIIIEFSRFIFNLKDSKLFLINFLKEFGYKIYNNQKENIHEDKVFNLIENLDINHDTIGNYYLVKKDSKNLNYFLKSYE
jgi:FkbM family methyltransferase